jgi:hypothetical protein
MAIDEERISIIDDAVASIKRDFAWDLQGHYAWPALLSSKDFMHKADLDAIFGGKQFVDTRISVVEANKLRDPRLSISVHGANQKTHRFVLQVWNGRPTRQTTSVLGRVGSIEIVRERIEEVIEARINEYLALIPAHKKPEITIS